MEIWWKSSTHWRKTRPGADCGSDHKLLIAKFRLKWKKIGKTIRPVKYYLSQTPFNYIVEVTNRFKGLDLVDRVLEELWKEVCNTVQEVVTKSIPKKKEMQEGKVVFWGSFANSWEKKRSKSQGGKGNIYPTEYKVPEKSKERWKKIFLSEQCKAIEENNRMGKTSDLIKKMTRYQGNILCKDGHDKGQKR